MEENSPERANGSAAPKGMYGDGTEKFGAPFIPKPPVVFAGTPLNIMAAVVGS